MAKSLIVRDVDPALILELKRVAAQHGRSAEAEHRQILLNALLRPTRKPFTQFLAEMPEVGLDEDFQFRR